MNRRQFWGAYAESKKGTGLEIATEWIAASDGQGKVAVDLGCGNSDITACLLLRQWRVIAIDYAPGVVRHLTQSYQPAIDKKQLQCVQGDVATVNLDQPVDLVIASDIFPYIDPSKFRATWEKIHRFFLKEGGILIGSLFCFGKDHRQINMLKEMGAWFLLDTSTALALAEQTGYKVLDHRIRHRGDTDPICFQFILQKKYGL